MMQTRRQMQQCVLVVPSETEETTNESEQITLTEEQLSLKREGTDGRNV